MSKYNGIDEREVKCCDTSKTSVEAGISFDELENGQKVLRFHFLNYINTKDGSRILTQETKSMWLNKKNINQLIKKLDSL